MATVQEDLVAGLEGFSGRLLGPDDDGYDEARRIHNGLIDKRPALIARCLGTADVAAAVDLARERGLEVSVRGGGHNVAGKAVTDGGVMIDLALMKGMHVDPPARTIRAQGGVTWGELNRETQLHGLAVTGGVVSTTGIAGLTLGGGLGYMMGKFGLSTDNLISAEVVTADGRVQTASDDENPDLFWAHPGRRRQLRRRDVVRVPAASGRPDRHRRARDPPVRGRARLPALHARVHGRPVRRDDALRRSPARAGRLGQRGSAGRCCAIPGRRSRREGSRAAAHVRLAARRAREPDALHAGQPAHRRRLPQGRAELLEVDVHAGALGRGDRHHGARPSRPARPP